jgi:hypothetical protein
MRTWWIRPQNIHSNQYSQETPLCFLSYDSTSITIKSANIKKKIINPIYIYIYINFLNITYSQLNVNGVVLC